jgi:hypothetical protein
MLKNKFKTLSTEIFNKIDQLEEHVAFLKKGLTGLLEENDIKDLPSYSLLKKVYSEYLTETPTLTVKEHRTDEQYDPLFAPPGVRRRATGKKHASKGPALDDDLAVELGLEPEAGPISAQKTSSSAQKAVSSVPSFMPDLSTSLLEDVGTKAKPQSKQVTTVSIKPKQNVEVKVKDTETVYIVEVLGKQYLQYNNYLYSPDSYLRVGEITSDGFKIGNASTKFESIELTPNGEYYMNDNIAHIRVADLNVFHGVGEMTESGEVGLWG